MATRNGSAEWRGDLQQGSGDLTVGDGVFEGQYSFASRFEEGEGTNPEELIAAAHAGCYSMQLSGVLTQAGTPPESIETEGRVPGLDEQGFTQHAEEAKKGCPVSRALAGVDEITLTARLAG